MRVCFITSEVFLGDALAHVESLVKEGGSIALASPRLPTGISMEDLIKRGYCAYSTCLGGSC